LSTLYGGETETKLIVSEFRGVPVPKDIKSKHELIRWALETNRFEEPISNGEFVFDLRCTRFGGTLHDLRAEGYDIATMAAKKRGHFLYYLVSTPADSMSMRKKGQRLLKRLRKAMA
tara:strand:- start:4112 stop:4462 length:351 start_codon:yes stop_codon:yes gene_type:complete